MRKLYRTTRIRFFNGIIYVDDTALVFPSRDVMIKALPIAQKIMADLGLEMHTGKCLDSFDEITGKQKIKESKTECMFVPGCNYFKRPARITSEAVNDDAVLDINV